MDIKQSHILSLKRILAVSLDALSPFVWILSWIIYSLYRPTGLEENYFDSLPTYLNIAVVVLAFSLLVEHIVVLKITGFTFSRYLLGYKLVNVKTNRPPGLFQGVRRMLCYVILSSTLLFVVSIIMMFIRKDNRTISDLLSGIKAIPYKTKLSHVVIGCLLMVVVPLCVAVNICVLETEHLFPKGLGDGKNIFVYLETEKKFEDLLLAEKNSGADSLVYSEVDPSIDPFGDDELTRWSSSYSKLDTYNYRYCKDEEKLKDAYNVFLPIQSLFKMRIRMNSRNSSLGVGREIERFIYCGENKLRSFAVDNNSEGKFIHVVYIDEKIYKTTAFQEYKLKGNESDESEGLK